MEAIKQWFQDWSDACEYARECVPDLAFATPREPYTALAGIALTCLLIWWRNERRLARLHRREAARVVPLTTGALQAALGEIQAAPSTAEKRAA